MSERPLTGSVRPEIITRFAGEVLANERFRKGMCNGGDIMKLGIVQFEAGTLSPEGLTLTPQEFQLLEDLAYLIDPDDLGQFSERSNELTQEFSADDAEQM